MCSDNCGLQREGSKFSAISFYLNYTVKMENLVLVLTDFHNVINMKDLKKVDH